MRSWDTECTGVDLWHGARPYFVTTCDEADEITHWEWDVDPETREPNIPLADLAEIEALYNSDGAVFQNPTFDVAAFESIPNWKWIWDWARIDDTLTAGHLLASNQPHSLDAMALVYLGVNIRPLEDLVEAAIKQAKAIVKAKFPTWKLAKYGNEDMPSAKKSPDKGKRARGEDKDKVWKFDMWLLRAICKRCPELLLVEEGWKQGDPVESHSWWSLLANYGNGDSSVTLPLFKVMRQLLEERGLWRIYQEKLKVLPIVQQMKDRGITLNKNRLDKLYKEYSEEAKKNNETCVRLSNGKLDALPAGGRSNKLTDTLFNELKLTTEKKTDSGQPSCDKYVLDDWALSLPPGRQLDFVKNLQSHRKRTKACQDMDGYRRFMLPWIPAWNGSVDHITGAGWYVLHPSLNPTGTDTLRWSSSNPNEQNISKKEGFNLRYCFGPAPGREWWSLDAKNIELRIPAYEAGEEEMIDIFERPNDPPYYGSYHMLVFDTLHPEMFAKDGINCKDIYESTWYQWTKNGNFAVGYGSVESSGTADRAYHVPGGFVKIKGRFKKIHGPGGLNDQQIAFAKQHGYVETIPDATVNPERGYPLLCTRTSYGHILPTVPLNYHVQSTAMWILTRGMIEVHKYLAELNIDAHLVMQIHDELVLDFPFKPNKANLPRIRKIKHILGSLGYDLVRPIPIPFGIKYHGTSWDVGETCA